MTTLTPAPALSRRSFLASAAAVGGGFMLGFHLPDAAASAAAPLEGAEVNAWIVIMPDESVTIRVARSEMGQGSFTALPMLVAEELECDWSKVRAEFASTAEHLRRNRVYGSMSTGGSRSIRESQEYLRKAGAAAREMLVAAAAAAWSVPAGECKAALGVITHTPSGRTATYGAVAGAASKLPPPKDVALKPPEQWTIIGRPVKRFDMVDKVLGKPVFGMDVRLPDMLYASVVACPVFGGKLKSHDAAAVAGMKGVRQVVALDDAVAVVADTWWQAQQAILKVPVSWDVGENGTVSSDSIRAFLKSGIEAASAPAARKDGDVAPALSGAAKVVEAEYEVPFLNHATMEPMNCTASVTAAGVEVWAPSQNTEASLAAAAEAAGVPLDKVEVHKVYLGGGFGRRGAFQDYVKQAVKVSQAVGRPVKLVWSREEDMRHGFYRPVSMVRFRGGLDAKGTPTALSARIAGQSILVAVRPDAVKDGMDKQFLEGIVDMPYQIPNLLVEYAMRNTHVPVGFWRSVNHSQNAFFKECFIDELAHAAGEDPYQFRRKMLGGKKRELHVLDTAAQKAGWGEKLPEGVFRGIALNEAYGSHSAHVAEVSVSAKGALKIHRIVCALDTGHVVNPNTVAAQSEGGIVYGLTAALFGEITIRDGRVEQSNFHDYPMMTMVDMPKVEVHSVPSGGFWGGAGEPPLPPATPAVCNAIFAATGTRIRSLPLRKHDLSHA